MNWVWAAENSIAGQVNKLNDRSWPTNLGTENVHGRQERETASAVRRSSTVAGRQGQVPRPKDIRFYDQPVLIATC